MRRIEEVRTDKIRHYYSNSKGLRMKMEDMNINHLENAKNKISKILETPRLDGDYKKYLDNKLEQIQFFIDNQPKNEN